MVCLSEQERNLNPTWVWDRVSTVHLQNKVSLNGLLYLIVLSCLPSPIKSEFGKIDKDLVVTKS